jgi:hypothetical protein
MVRRNTSTQAPDSDKDRFMRSSLGAISLIDTARLQWSVRKAPDEDKSEDAIAEGVIKRFRLYATATLAWRSPDPAT